MILGQERQEAQRSADLVIRGTIAALAILSGVGVAYALWSALHASPATVAVVGAVAALTLGLVLVSLALPSRTARLFLVLMAASMAVAFFAGSGAFAALSS
jgi:cellobiose-specific phosphotransferase system component IIC